MSAATCPSCGQAIPVQGYSVDLTRNRLLLDGAPVALMTNREAEILASLLKAKPNALSRNQLLDAMYVPTVDDSPALRTVDSVIKRLRRTLKSTGVTIHTAYGRGYYAEVA